MAYTYSGSNVSETVTLGYEAATSTIETEAGLTSGTQVAGTGGEGEPAAVYWYTDGDPDETVGSATILCNYKGQPDLIETFNCRIS